MLLCYCTDPFIPRFLQDRMFTESRFTGTLPIHLLARLEFCISVPLYVRLVWPLPAALYTSYHTPNSYIQIGSSSTLHYCLMFFVWIWTLYWETYYMYLLWSHNTSTHGSVFMYCTLAGSSNGFYCSIMWRDCTHSLAVQFAVIQS